MQMEPEKPPSRWESAAEPKPPLDAPGSGAPSVSSVSSQSGASSVFSAQNDDSPLTSLSSQSTSPSLSQSSGKSRRCSELLTAEDDIHEPPLAPASKKCKLTAPEAPGSSVPPSSSLASKPGHGCGALRMNRALFVENLVDAAVTTIASIWGRFSRESRQHSSRDSASSNNTLPLDLFVREILRRSRTNCSTLQAALLYCIRCKRAVEASVDKMADTADALPPSRTSREPEPCFPSLAASAPYAAAQLGCLGSAPGGAQSMSPLLCGRRMFLAAIVVASKFLQDQTYSNRTWSKISGLAPREIEQLERIFLHTIQYDLVVDAAQWSRWTQELSSNWVRAKPAQPVATDASRPAAAAAAAATAAAGGRKSAPDQRLHRAISENVIGQTLPYDAGILQSDRDRHTRAAFVRRPSSA